MNHQAFAQLLGNYGEFVGAIAVLATLLYLTVQVRHSRTLLEENRKLALSQVFQTRVGFRLEGHWRQAESSELAKILGKLEKADGQTDAISIYETLEPGEKQQFKHLHMANVMNLENTVYQRELGLIDDRHMSQVRAYANANFLLWEHLGALTPRVLDWYKNGDHA